MFNVPNGKRSRSRDNLYILLIFSSDCQRPSPNRHKEQHKYPLRRPNVPMTAQTNILPNTCSNQFRARQKSKSTPSRPRQSPKRIASAEMGEHTVSLSGQPFEPAARGQLWWPINESSCPIQGRCLLAATDLGSFGPSLSMQPPKPASMTPLLTTTLRLGGLKSCEDGGRRGLGTRGHHSPPIHTPARPSAGMNLRRTHKYQ